LSSQGKTDNNGQKTRTVELPTSIHQTTTDVPKCDDLYISTKTKVLYLNQPIDIHRIFWLIPIADYNTQRECVIKKQIKIVSKTKEEYEYIFMRLKKEFKSENRTSPT
jgi:hypothetical protein